MADTTGVRRLETRGPAAERRRERRMTRPGLQRKLLAAALVAACLLPQPPAALAEPVELRQPTLDAFQKYVRLTEVRLDGELRAGAFLFPDARPDAERQSIYARLRQGEAVMQRLETRENGALIECPKGLIHHWVGAVFVPGATLERTLALMQDYDRHQAHFSPDVMRSKLVERSGDDFKVYLRFRKKKVITVILDTRHEAHYSPLSATRAFSRSYSTHINEVENAGKANEQQKPEGNDGGFLWRIYSYWRFEEKDGGTYIECESISLTRDIPAGLGWLIRPFVTGIPKESLSFTLNAARTALVRKPAAGS